MQLRYYPYSWVSVPPWCSTRRTCCIISMEYYCWCGQLLRFHGWTDGAPHRKEDTGGKSARRFSGMWFFSIYITCASASKGRWCQVPTWNGVSGFGSSAISGFLCHSPQSSLSDYYRQIHLFFLKGKEGSELDNYAQQRAIANKRQRENSLRAHSFITIRTTAKESYRTPAFR